MGLVGLKKENIIRLLRDDRTFATVLLAICIDSFTTECFEWEADTVVSELRHEYGVELSQVARDKINALLTVLTTDQVYFDPMVFWQVGNVLSGTPANFQTGADPLTVDEAAWVAVEIALTDMADDDHTQPTYSPEVRAMIGAILRQEGFSQPPQFLKWAELPPRTTVLDENSEQAQASRDEDLEADLVEGIRSKLDLLNQQLRQLPFVEQPSTSSATPPRDFLSELLKKDGGSSTKARSGLTA